MKPERFSDRLASLVGDEGKAAFASRCGFSEGALRNYLGGGMASADKALKIADACGVSFRWLIAGEGPMRPTLVTAGAPSKRAELAERLAQAVEIAGGLDNVCTKTGLTESALKAMLAAETDVSAADVVQIADEFGLSIEWLATGRDSAVAGDAAAGEPYDEEVLRATVEEVKKILDEDGADLTPEDLASFIVLGYRLLQRHATRGRSGKKVIDSGMIRSTLGGTG